jgi:hypothetical protein
MTAFLCAACSSAVPSAPASAPTVSAVSNPTLAPVASSGQVDEGDVRKVGDALLAANSFSMHGQLKDEDGASVDWKMEFVKPDRQHTRITAAGQTIESITIGSADYVKLGSAWTKSASGSDQTAQIVPLSNPDELARSFKQSTSNGDKMVKGAVDTVDGAQCQEWTITSVDGEQANACIGLSDNLPRRFTMSAGEMYFSDFNAPLKIEAPI